MTKVDARMDSYFTINVSTPDEGNYSTSTGTGMNAHDAGIDVRFLVDRGACHSLLPRPLFRTPRSLSKTADIQLVANNGSAIPIYGYKKLTLSFGSIKYHWKFLVADVTLSTSCEPTDEYAYLLTSDTKDFHPELRQRLIVPAKHTIKSLCQDDGVLVFARFRRLALNLLAAAKQTFTEVKETNLCPNASSPLLSLLHIVLKKDGSLCLCGYVKHSNMQTEPEHCPLPNIANVTSYFHKDKVFSTLDLLKEYPQAPINQEDIPKTKLTT
ncbi:uncharacterized protein [Palaemon carinicauda]|uniref:uncharacterized protein n=1 Tax=Palaemon carinicauda TaxID=392227 RepID=UPI0035B5E351